MKSAITSKFQTTIPKVVREILKLSINDTLEWKIERGRAMVFPLNKPFLKYRNAVKTGAGNIARDIRLARERRMKDFE